MVKSPTLDSELIRFLTLAIAAGWRFKMKKLWFAAAVFSPVILGVAAPDRD
jgi:hypothetical protein